MAAEEVIHAAILQLRSKSLETLGVIKDLCRREAEEGLGDQIANAALRLAQLEGGLVTLQHYQEMALEYANTPQPESNTEEEPAEDPPRPASAVTSEQSPTLRRSLSGKREK